MTHHAPCAVIYFSALLAETAVAANWYEPLIASGPIGVVLLWFMLRSEKKTSELTHAIHNMASLLSLAILELKHGDADIAKLTVHCKELAHRLSKHETPPS